MNIFESTKIALESIKANKMRSFLTMLGIIIGISSVITIVALGQGGKNQIAGEFEKIGAASVNINLDTSKAQATDYFTLEDVKQIKEKIDTIKYATPVFQMRGMVVAENKSKTGFFTGGSPDIVYINNSEITYGRFFNEREFENGAAVGIVDEYSAKVLFGYKDVVGESIKLGEGALSKKITIIGVEKGFSSPFGDGENSGRPVQITIPITIMNSLQNNGVKIKGITIMATSKENTETAGYSAINMIEGRHNNKGKELYKAESVLKVVEQINSVLNIFTAFIGAVAAISLLVGGIGVMNIMLVSVTERTREIGIRKAIGATTRAILLQFLTESLIISLIGGIIGMTLGILGAELIGNFAGITPTVSLSAILGAILFSSAVGIFFGIYPARKAARLDPIDALRYE